MSEFPIYYLVISAVVCLCLIWIRRRAVAQNFKPQFVLDLSLGGLIFGFIGARGFHVIYEYPELYLSEPWRIFDFGRGGYVYYGGLLLGLSAVWLYLKKKKTLAIGQYFDLAAPVISAGYAFGRIACLLSGCCYGPFTEVFWHVEHRHPTPLYATIIECLVLFLILYLEKNKNKVFSGYFRESGRLFFTWLSLHSLTRFFLEFWRDDFRGPSYLLSISSWISLGLLGLSVGFLLKDRK